MTKTIIALDNLLSWYIDQMQQFFAFDFRVLSDYSWMHWTIIPMFVYGLFMLFKYVFLWGIVMMPVGYLFSTIARAVLRPLFRGARKELKKYRQKKP